MTKLTIQSLGLCLLLVVLTGCSGKDSHQKVVTEMIAASHKMVESLGSIKDEGSAKKAAGVLEKIAGQFSKLAERSKALGAVPEPVKKVLTEKLKASEGKIEEGLSKAMATLSQKPELLDIIKAPMEKLGTAAGSLGEFYIDKN